MALLPYQVTLVAKQDAPYNVLPDTDISIRKVSDDTLVQIYADEAGLIPIAQPGAKTDSRGVFSFFADGSSDLLKAVWSDGVTSYSEQFYIGDHSKLTNLNPADGSAHNADDISLAGYSVSWEQIADSTLKNNTFNDSNASYDFTAVLRRKAANSPTRQYIIPNGDVTGNTKTSAKLFFDDFTQDPSNYRDFNLTCTEGFNGGAVSNSDGAVLMLNMKTLGSYRDTPPDVVECYNDAVSVNDIGRRMIQHIDYPSAGSRRTAYIYGTGVDYLSKDDIAYYERSVGMANNTGIRIAGADGVGNTVLSKLSSSNVVEDTIRGSLAFSRDQYGRQKQKIFNSQTYSQAYASSLTPNIHNGGYQKVFVTGDMTVSSILNGVNGDEITLHLTCDASTRVVTFSAGFKMDSSLAVSNQITLTTNSTTIVKFRSDGTAYFQQAPHITVQ